MTKTFLLNSPKEAEFLISLSSAFCLETALWKEVLEKRTVLENVWIICPCMSEIVREIALRRNFFKLVPRRRIHF